MGKRASKPNPKRAPCPVDLRWMNRGDLPDVLRIERESFEFPWREDDFLRCLRQRNVIGKVAVTPGGATAGFVIYELHKTRFHVLNLAVAQVWRRWGIGRQIVEHIQSTLREERRSRIMLEVRETNLPAQLFFHALGFRAVSVLRDFYDDTPEDAYLFQFRLPKEAPQCRS